MRRRSGTAQKGFTLIELLIVIAIIGILASVLIPNLLDALNKAKQKRTMADMRVTGTAMFSWLSDQVGAAAAGQEATVIDLGDYTEIDHEALRETLVPQYIEHIPERDGWDALQALKNDPDTRDLPVLVCTILREEQLALALGADGFIRKPLALPALLEALDRWAPRQLGRG